MLQAVLGTLVGGLPAWLLAGLAPALPAELHLDAARLGGALGLSFVATALTAVPAGRLVERIGWQRGLRLNVGLSALSLLGLAAAGDSWPAVLVLLCVGAVGGSLSHPSANVGIAQRVVAGRQGAAFGVKQASVPLTTLLAGLASPLVAQTVGWRWAFASAGGGAALLLAALLREHLPPPTPAAEGGRGPARRPGVPAALLVLALGSGLVTAATLSLGGFLVLSAVDSGVDPDTAGYLLAAGSAVGIVSRVVTGVLADRGGADHLLVVAAMMAVGAAGMALLAAFDSLTLLLLGTALAFGIGWAWNGLFALVVVRTNADAPAAATGVLQTALAVAGIVGPPAFGLCAHAASYAVAWSGAALLSAAGAGTVLVGRRMLPAARGRARP